MNQSKQQSKQQIFSDDGRNVKFQNGFTWSHFVLREEHKAKGFYVELNYFVFGIWCLYNNTWTASLIKRGQAFELQYLYQIFKDIGQTFHHGTVIVLCVPIWPW